MRYGEMRGDVRRSRTWLIPSTRRRASSVSIRGVARGEASEAAPTDLTLAATLRINSARAFFRGGASPRCFASWASSRSARLL